MRARVPPRRRDRDAAARRLLASLALAAVAAACGRDAAAHLAAARAFGAGNAEIEALDAAARRRILEELDAAIETAHPVRDRAVTQEARFLRQRIYARAGLASLAEKDLLELLELDPGDFGARLALGVLHDTLGDEEKAIPEIDRALAQRPDQPEANFWSADAHRRRASRRLERFLEAVEPRLSARAARACVESADALAYLDAADPRAVLLGRGLEEGLAEASPLLVETARAAVDASRADRATAYARYRRAFREAPDRPWLPALEGLLVLGYRSGRDEETLAALALARILPPWRKHPETVFAGAMMSAHRVGPAASLPPVRSLANLYFDALKGRPSHWAIVLERMLEARAFDDFDFLVVNQRATARYDPTLSIAIPHLTGVAAILRGRIDEARPVLREASRRSDRDRRRAAAAARLLARAAFAAGDLGQVREATQTLQTLDEKDVDGAAIRALAELRLGGELSIARDGLERAIELDPAASRELAVAWEEAQAQVFEKQGRLPRAMAEALSREGRPFDPDYPDAWLYLAVARALDETGRPELARRNYFEASYRSREFLPADRALGLFLAREGPAAEAATVLRRVVRRAPDDAQAIAALASLGASAPADASLLVLDRAPAAVGRLVVARRRLDRGDAAMALAVLGPPGPSPDELLLRARAHRLLGRFDEARRELAARAAAAAEDEASRTERLALAAATLDPQDGDSAAAAHLDPSLETSVRRDAAAALLRLGLATDAGRLLDSLPDPPSAETLRLRGIGAFLRGDPDAARELADRATGMGDDLAARDLLLLALAVGEPALASEAASLLAADGDPEEVRWASFASGEAGPDGMPEALLGDPDGRFVWLANEVPGWESVVLARSTLLLPRGGVALRVLRARALIRAGRDAAAFLELRAALQEDPRDPTLLESILDVAGHAGLDPLLVLGVEPRAAAAVGAIDPPDAALAARDPFRALATLRGAALESDSRLGPREARALLESFPEPLRPLAADALAAILARTAASTPEEFRALLAVAPRSAALRLAALRERTERSLDSLSAIAADVRSGDAAAPSSALVPRLLDPFVEADPLGAADLLHAAREADPSDPGLLRFEIATLERTGQSGRALDAWRRYAEIYADPDAPLAYARLLARVGAHPEDDPRSWIQSLPLFPGAPASVGDDVRAEASGVSGAIRAALEASGRRERGRASPPLREALARIPESAATDALLAEAAVRDGDFQEALRASLRSRARGDSPRALLFHVLALAFEERPAEAAALLEGDVPAMAAATGPVREALLDLRVGLAALAAQASTPR